MAKNQFLTFEIHLNDPVQVESLQGNPPGDTSTQGAQKAIIRAPDGAAVEFGTQAVPTLPLFGPGQSVPAGTPYLYSEWFTAHNLDYPTNVATFTRKSGGWFGFPQLFGQTTKFYWRGVFVYDPPLTTVSPADGGTRAAIAERRWISGFQAFESSLQGTQSSTNLDAKMTRDAARTVDSFGVAFRRESQSYSRSTTDYTGGGASTQPDSWERIYIRWRKAGSAAVRFWEAEGTPAATNGLRMELLATGQIALSNMQATIPTLIGTSPALALNQWTKLDIVFRYGTGTVRLYFDNVLVITATVPVGVGLGAAATNHQASVLGTNQANGWTAEFDIGYWHNARIPQKSGADAFDGIDFENGSRAVLIRPNGFASAHAGWTGDFRLLLQRPMHANATFVESTTSGATLAVVTDSGDSIKNLPGQLGIAAFVVHKWGHRGTSSGTLGYKIGNAAPVMAAITEGAGATKWWNSVMFRPAGNVLPTDLQPLVTDPPLELHHVKGADVTIARAGHLMATAEVIGIFGNEDYPATAPAALRMPLPFLGVHNAPYPRSPWANSASPPLSPVVLKTGTYVGNGTGQDLTFRAPVHFLWIRRVTAAGGVPVTTRWWSSRLGSGRGSQQGVEPMLSPDQRINLDFVPTGAGTPTGIGALPNRSAEVATFVNANLGLLDGNDEHKRDLLGMLCRELNQTIPADGFNWGLLQKTNQGDFIPSDILVWKPTNEHVDVLTDTGPFWNVIGVAPAEWIWIPAAEGAQNQSTTVRIAGADPEVNESAETYAYVAVADPGQRFMLNGAFAHGNEALPTSHALIDTGFTPQGGFFHYEKAGVNAAISTSFKGPGNALADMSRLNGSQVSGLTFAAGALTIDTGVSLGDFRHTYAYNLWRMNDGSGDPGVGNVVRITSYVGNGAGGTRLIDLFGGAMPAATGKRPLWAIVMPNTWAAPGYYFKDPTHASGTSGENDGTIDGLAIVSGAPDQIGVGTTLNALGMMYQVFVLMGGTAAGADGWSLGGEFVPVEPTSPTGTQFGGDAGEPVAGGAGGGGVPPGGDTAGAPGTGPDDVAKDLASGCVAFTQRVFNDALSRIGISQRIVNAATDTTEVADLCRQHYARAIEQTLRDFPWPFATRYQTLTLLAGSTTAPVNRDWTYSYRRPIDCVFERRVAVLRDGAVDPTPPPFQLSYDNLLQIGRIFTNQQNAQLEYTARPECTAGVGDPLFLDALTWRLAARIAGPLTRIADVVKLCIDQYDAKIANAFEVIRPGNPGPRTTIDALLLDPGTGALTANINVVNRALIRIGAPTVANLASEQSRSAEAMRLLFEEELRSCLRDFPWSFATAYVSAPTLVGGTETVAYNDDWQYAYRYPTNAVKIRRIVTEHRRSRSERDPEMFRVGADATGLLVFCNRLTPTFEYTARVQNCVLLSETLFRDALAWRLAASAAPSLASVDPDTTEQLGRGPKERPKERKATEAQLRERAATAAWRQYYLVLEKARVADASEQQQDPQDIDADWIRGRD